MNSYLLNSNPSFIYAYMYMSILNILKWTFLLLFGECQKEEIWMIWLCYWQFSVIMRMKSGASILEHCLVQVSEVVVCVYVYFNCTNLMPPLLCLWYIFFSSNCWTLTSILISQIRYIGGLVRSFCVKSSYTRKWYRTDFSSNSDIGWILSL